MLYIHHVTILTPDQEIRDGAVLVDDSEILAVGKTADIACPPDAVNIDATGLLMTPGFIDLQLNGAFGHDFTANPARIWPVAAQLPRFGVTAFLPTIITSPVGKVAAAQDVLLYPPLRGATGASPLGLHIEGPFLSPEKRGAHNPEYLRLPDKNITADWIPEHGIRLVTLAPELPGALNLVHTLAMRGVAVSAGHSTATFAEAQAGFNAGIRYGTHLFNAMSTLHHREPGLAGALLDDATESVAGLIADGIHTHPSMVNLAWKALGPTRLNLVSDAMAALGMPPGLHRLGDFDVVVDETSARLLDGTLAGSVLSLDAALRNLISFAGCSLRKALPTVTSTPAKVLGMEATRGHIAPGYVSDLVLLTPELHVHATIVNGKVVYQQAPLDRTWEADYLPDFATTAPRARERQMDLLRVS